MFEKIKGYTGHSKDEDIITGDRDAVAKKLKEIRSHSERREYHDNLGFYEKMQEEHEKEASKFEEAEWHPLNCAQPFYMHSTNLPEGTLRTVSCTKTRPTEQWGMEWWWKEGDVMSPENVSDSTSVFEVKDGKWEYYKKENL